MPDDRGGRLQGLTAEASRHLNDVVAASPELRAVRIKDIISELEELLGGAIDAVILANGLWYNDRLWTGELAADRLQQLLAQKGGEAIGREHMQRNERPLRRRPWETRPASKEPARKVVSVTFERTLDSVPPPPPDCGICGGPMQKEFLRLSNSVVPGVRVLVNMIPVYGCRGCDFKEYPREISLEFNERVAAAFEGTGLDEAIVYAQDLRRQCDRWWKEDVNGTTKP